MIIGFLNFNPLYISNVAFLNDHLNSITNLLLQYILVLPPELDDLS
jgi:hypothetical protein